MLYSFQVPLSVPFDQIALPDWLFGMSEQDYAFCARGHRGCGVIGGRRRLGMINVESIGGSLIIQHYETRRADADHVTMVSEASRVYLMHLVPVTASVTWDMQVSKTDENKSMFRCEVGVHLPKLVHLIGLTTATPLFVRRHLVEETIGFARDIERKLGPSEPFFVQ